MYFAIFYLFSLSFLEEQKYDLFKKKKKSKTNLKLVNFQIF